MRYSIARGFGFVLNFYCQSVILLASRLLLTALRSTALSAFLPMDQAMPAFHIVVGYAITVSAILHTIFHLIAGLTPGVQGIGWAPGWGGWTHAAVTGFFLLFILGIMVASSLPAVRRRRFELFYVLHIYLAALFFGLFIFHAMLSGRLYSWKWVAGPLAIYAVDRIARTLTTHRGNVKMDPASAAMRFVSPTVLRVALPRLFNYKPGQYAELRIPALSGTAHEWHPFTIASAPHEVQMVFFIKDAGDWTHRLHEAVAAAASADGSNSADSGDSALGLDVHVRGPFGAPAQHAGQYERVLLIAGGVGATPFISIAKAAERVIRQAREGREPIVGGEGAVDKSSGAVAGAAAGGELTLELPPGISRVGQSFMVPLTPPVAATTVDCAEMASSVVAESGEDTVSQAAFVQASEGSCKDGASGSDDGAPGWAVPADAYGVFATNHSSLISACRSVTASCGVLWLLLARVALFGVASTVDAATMEGTRGLSQYSSRGLLLADVALAAAAAAPIVAAAVLEVTAAPGRRRLPPTASLVAAAVAVVGVALPAAAAAGATTRAAIPMGYLQALVLLPAAVATFLWRHTRLLRQRLAVAPRANASGASLRSLDFVWTAPSAADDGWVVEELAPLVDNAKGYVRLHRFGTREAPPSPASAPTATATASGEWDVEAGGVQAKGNTTRWNMGGRWDAGYSRRLSLHYGRPQWAALLDRLVANSRSGSVVGVFFCGAPAMGDAVREAAVEATTESRRRGMAARVRDNDDWGEAGGRTGGGSFRYGYNVRVVVRVENF